MGHYYTISDISGNIPFEIKFHFIYEKIYFLKILLFNEKFFEKYL